MTVKMVLCEICGLRTTVVTADGTTDISYNGVEWMKRCRELVAGTPTPVGACKSLERSLAEPAAAKATA
jgi:hypothetical protein